MKTLRDEFAMAVLSTVANWHMDEPEKAAHCYRIAQAMMEERKLHLPTYITDRENNTP